MSCATDVTADERCTWRLRRGRVPDRDATTPCRPRRVVVDGHGVAAPRDPDVIPVGVTVVLDRGDVSMPDDDVALSPRCAECAGPSWSVDARLAARLTGRGPTLPIAPHWPGTSR